MKNFVLILLAVLAFSVVLVSCTSSKPGGNVTDVDINENGDEISGTETPGAHTENFADTQTPEDTEPAADTEEQMDAFVPEDFLEFDGERYKLTFFDGFDGTKLDTTKWERCPEWNRQDLGGKWDDDRAYLDGKGNLVLEAKRDANGNLS